ncbi:MAG: hypothetical protein OXC31_08005 [Spirochaetaceae bacterium]|nr:hypothetical protein [Spirochaetaceae bacterium]
MTDLGWHFLRSRAMALSAEDMANPLRLTRLSKAELLMRETIQNSVDERSGDEPVRFVVSKVDLQGAEKRNAVERLRLPEIRERAECFPQTHGWFVSGETCLRNLESPDVPLSIVSLSDYGTNGLGGQWNRGMSTANRFHNLVLSIGGSGKLGVASSLLGSHGLGKMVYALTSNVRTVAYYSVFAPDAGSDGHHARFMGTGFFPKHRTKDGVEFTGHAFLGRPSGDAEYPSAPYTDSDADDFVDAMGFPTRSREDTGLTVFLFDCPLTIDELRLACEKYWWPRLIDDHSPDYVSLEFVDRGTEAPAPRPATNPRILPFVSCYRNLRDGHAPPGYETVKLPKRGMTGGKLCLRAADGATGGQDELTNAVALVRRGLVIKYEREYAKEGCPEAIGVFDVATDNESAFTYSEPPAHDEWNPNDDRLLTSMGAEYSRLIKTTLNTIRNSFRDYQIRLEERPKPKIAEDISFLDEILGPMFRRRPRRRNPPIPQARAITIHKTSRSEPRGSVVRQLLDISIGLAPAAAVDERECQVAVELQPLVDSHGVARGTVPRTVYGENGDVVADAKSRSFRLTLTQSRLKLTAEALVHPSWRVQWVVSARPLDVGS